MAVCCRTSLATIESTYSASCALVIHCGIRTTIRPSTMRADTDLRRFDERMTSTSIVATLDAVGSGGATGSASVGAVAGTPCSHSSVDHKVSTVPTLPTGV